MYVYTYIYMHIYMYVYMCFRLEFYDDEKYTV